MAIQRELTVQLANSPGTLGRVAQVLGNERINMLAMSVDGSGALRMVVDNPLHAAGALCASSTIRWTSGTCCTPRCRTSRARSGAW